MGVRMLNRYLREYSPDAIKEITLNELKGRKIAIDISIFLYKFKGDNMLFENMYKMIQLFRTYYVTPIFVFDGKPPDEKLDVLSERDSIKKIAKAKCESIEKELNENTELSEEERSRLIDALKREQKNCLRITNANIRDVKNLITLMGVSYLEADGEADELCVLLVKKKIAWACMSDDMDMFVYGCQRVLRSFDLKKGTMMLYTMTDILKNLKMNLYEFRQVCLLSGTDYNKTNFTIFSTMGMFYKYLKRRKPNTSFYDWLIYIKTIDTEYKEVLDKTCDMFILDNTYIIVNHQLTNKKIVESELKIFMDNHSINYLLIE